MKKFLLRIAVSFVGSSLFAYLEEVASKSRYKSLSKLVSSVKAFYQDIPESVLTSLNDSESRQALEQLVEAHDTAMAIAAYDLVVEVADERLQGVFLESFEREAYALGKDILRSLTNENKDNANEIKDLFNDRSYDLISACLNQAEAYVKESNADEYRQKQVAFAFEIARRVLVNPDADANAVMA